MKIFIILLLISLSLLSCATPMGPVKDPTNRTRVLPAKNYIEGIKPEYQFGPECVPVSVKMVLQYYGVNVSIKEVADGLRQTYSGTETTNIDPYVKKYGFSFLWWQDPEFEKPWTKQYISSNMPVLAVGGYVGVGQKSHMVVVMGYDDGRKRFSILNPWYKGVVTHTYHEFMEWHTHKGVGSSIGVIRR